LHDKKVPPILKEMFYLVVVRPTMLYEVECWLVKSSHIQTMKFAEMRMLSWMCRHTKTNKIINEDIWYKLRGISGGQNTGGKIEILWTCEKEMHGFPGVEV